MFRMLGMASLGMAAALAFAVSPAQAAGCNGHVNVAEWGCAPWDNNNGPQFPHYVKPHAQPAKPPQVQRPVVSAPPHVAAPPPALLAPNRGNGVIAAGGGNAVNHNQNGNGVIAAGGGNTIAAGGGNVVGPGGSSLLSTNGGSFRK